MAEAFLGLGSNIGDRISNVREAVGRLRGHGEIQVRRVSSLYETSPVGFVEQEDFINAVVSIETSMEPLRLLSTILEIEKEMGRTRNLRWGPRVIDIDLLIYDEVTIDTPQLCIPHPRIAERAFVLIPLAELAPDRRLPDGRTVSQAAEGVADQQMRKCAEAI